MTNYKGRLLLVDDDLAALDLYRAVFSKAGYLIHCCGDVTSLKEELTKHSYDAIFLDLNLGDESGIDGLSYVLKHAPYSLVFILTADKQIDVAVECMNRGAYWYFTKGTNPDQILEKLESFFSRAHKLESPSNGDDVWRSKIIGSSDAMRDTCDTIAKLKSVDSTVLILGESGTGKEVVARAIHQSSTRNSERFEAINCGAIPENLLESELFGHKRGAFTDAKQDRKGIFEICSKGTLLLDEIGDMDLNLQTKLLRVLQERKITPVGSTTSIPIETRVIAATHRDLKNEIESGRFREDLYYRLSVVVVEIPPLRHRKKDIAELSEFFLNRFNSRFSKHVKPISQANLNRLKSYDWPGNVRELENTIERGVVLSGDGELTIENMFSHLSALESSYSKGKPKVSSFEEHPVFDLPLTEAKQLFEKTYIERLLTLSQGNVAELARRSGRYRADLYRMLERYDVNVDDYRAGKV